MPSLGPEANDTSKGPIKELERQFALAIDVRDDVNIIRCLDEGVDPNYRLSDLHTAAHVFSRRGDLGLMRKLATYKGWNVDAQTESGRTPLHWAVLTRKRRMARLLLEKYGANPDIKDYAGKTCLHYAAEGKNYDMTQILLNSNAKVNEMDLFGRTPLTIIVLDRPSLLIARLLGAYGVDMNNQYGSGGLHLFLAAVLYCNSFAQLEFIPFLVEIGADVNMVDPITKRNALHYVAITGYVPCAEVLVELKCNLNHKGHGGKTPLVIAVAHKNYELANYFLKVLKLREQLSTNDL